MKDQKIADIVMQMAVLIIIGSYLLLNQDNAFSEAFSRDKYDPKKVSRSLGFGLFGIAICCVPSLLSVIFEKKWLSIFTILFLLVLIIVVHVYESKGKLK